MYLIISISIVNSSAIVYSMVDEDEDEDVYCTMVVARVDSNVLLYEYMTGKI